MIVEELVARLGFKTTGLGDLSKFERGLDRVRKGTRSFGTAMNAGLTAAFGQLSDRLASSGGVSAYFVGLNGRLKETTALAGTMAGRLLKIAAVGGIVAAGIGLAVAAILKLGQALVSAGGAAAQLRRQMQIKAAFGRTTAANTEAMAKGFENIAPGLGGDAYKKAWEDLSEKASEAIGDLGGKTAKMFKDAGAPLLDKRGKQRDTSAIFDDVVKSYLDRQARVRQARMDSDDDPTNKRKLARANSEELKFYRKDAENYPGLTKDLREFLFSIKDFAELSRRREDANARNPGWTRDQDERATRVSAEYQKLLETLAGLSAPLTQLGIIIADNLLGPLNSLGSALLSWGKRLGIVNKTEVEAAEEAKSETDRGDRVTRTKAAVDKALSSIDEGTSGSGSFLRALFAAGLVSQAERKNITDLKGRYDQEAAIGPGNAEAIERAAAALTAMISAITSRFGGSDNTKPLPPSKPDFLKRAEDYKTQSSPTTAAERLSQDVTVSGTLTGSADVSGSATVTGQFTLDATGFANAINTRVDAKLAGALATQGAIGRGSAKSMGTATAGAGTP